MRKVVLIGMFLLVLSFIVVGCSEKAPIVIGFVGGLTDNNSAVAIAGRDAVQMAIDEINAKGGLLGRKVVLEAKDDKSDFEQAKIVDRAFIEEGVTVVIGHMMSGMAPAMLEAISGQNILFFAPTMSTHTLTGIDDNFMRNTLTNIDQGASIARYVIEKENKSRVLVLYSNTNQTFVEGMKHAVVSTFESLGGTVVYQHEIPEKDTAEMESAIMEGVQQQADSVILIMNAGDVAMVSQIIAKNNFPLSIYSGTWGMTADLIRMGGQTVEGIKFPTEFDLSNTNESYLEFERKYKSNFEKVPDFGAVHAYDAAMVILQAIEKAQSTDPDKIKAAIIEIETFEGLQKTFRIDAFGDCIGKHFIFMVKDGAFVAVD